MNLSAIFTVAALLVAVFAVMPQYKRLELKMRTNGFIWLMFLALFAIVLYLQFYSSYVAVGWAPKWELDKWEITPERASFLVLFFGLWALYCYLKSRRLSISDVKKFHDYFLQLKNERKYNELFSFIEGNLDFLEKACQERFWRVRARRWIEKNSERNVFDFRDGLIRSSETLFDKALRKACRCILFIWREDYQVEKSLANDICQKIQTDDGIVAAMCEDRHDIIISILRKDMGNRIEYAGTCLRKMIQDNKSQLSREILGFGVPINWSNHEKNSILRFLFEDCSVASNLWAWQPIGEFVISELQQLRLGRKLDRYNDPGEEDDSQRGYVKELPFFYAVWFFDVMIKSSLKQNFEHHMWIIYFDYITKRILLNININEEIINLRDEHPTKYHKLLYEIVDALCDGARSPIDPLLRGYEIPVFESTVPSHQEVHILKYCYTTLASVNKQIIMSDKVDDKFKNDILEMVYDRYFDLRRSEGREKYAETLRNAIRCGGVNYGDMINTIRETPPEYKNFLLNGLRHRVAIDTLAYPLGNIEELREILEEDLTSPQPHPIPISNE